MKIKIIVIVTIIFMLGSSFIVSANIKEGNLSLNIDLKESITPEHHYNDWEHYPYSPPGTDITFPDDEGAHKPNLVYPKEWWYANFHLIGQTSGTEYGAFGTYCKNYPVRFFSIFDHDLQKMYSNIKLGILNAGEGKLDLTFSTLLDKEYWYTKETDDGELIPFQYKFMMRGKAREEDKEMLEINVDMHCIKPPLIVGGDGLVDIGKGWSYYYCQTKIKVTGTVKVHGITEEVKGFAWIDHQWGDFNVGLPKNRVLWEWFSIKLDDNREIVVCDTWQMDTGERYETTYDGLNFLDANNKFELLEDYTITQLDFWKDPISKKEYAIKWRITEPSKQINITVEADYHDQLIHVHEIIDPIMPVLLWEGSCSVSGTIGGASVSGKAYTELTHSWKNNENTQYLQEINQESQTLII